MYSIGEFTCNMLYSIRMSIILLYLVRVYLYTAKTNGQTKSIVLSLYWKNLQRIF